MSTRLYVVCDDCGRKSEEMKNGGGMKTGTLRGELRQKGWVTKACGHDYCPTCVKEGPAGNRPKKPKEPS